MALPDFEFCDGFDKYGEGQYINAVSSTVPVLTDFTATSDWDTLINMAAAGCSVYMVPAKVGTGRAVSIRHGNQNLPLTAFSGIVRTMPSTYARSLGGVTMSRGTNNNANRAIYLGRAGTTQVTIRVSGTTGLLEVWRGNNTALLGTGTTVFATGVEECVEWDVTFNTATGIVKVWVNGTLEINLSSQNTSPVAGNLFNQVGLGVVGSGFIEADLQSTFDHFYAQAFTAAGGSETPFLTNPLVDTSFTDADDSTAFISVIGVVGLREKTEDEGSFFNQTGNVLYLMPATPEQNCTLDSIVFMPRSTVGAARFRAVLYADNAGAPGNIIHASTTEVGGTVANTPLVCPLSTPQALTSGTPYWIGVVMNNNTVQMPRGIASNIGYSRAITYPTAPSPAAATSGQATWTLFGRVSVPTENYVQVGRPRALGNSSYNASSTVGAADVYLMEALATAANDIHLVAVKAVVSKSDAGARTVDLNIVSGATTSPGSAPSQSISGTPALRSTYFRTDPNTGLPWTAADVTASKAGYEVAT